MGKEFVYYEKQNDLMCGQHALNMLLQRKEFDASHFTQYVERLDQRERELTGVPSETFKSQNASESGYFSIQVLQEALISQNLSLHDINKPNYAKFMFHPEEAHGFIVNQSQHWYALRRFGEMWFILNSISNGPRYISTPLLQPYLVKLIENFSSIYVVEGDLGVCEADMAAMRGELTVIDAILARHQLDKVVQTVGNDNVDEELLRAIAASVENDNADGDLQKALAASLEHDKKEAHLQQDQDVPMDTAPPPPPAAAAAVPPPTTEEVRSKRAEFLARFG